MEALTVWQPWAWAIGAGLKLIENRTWVPGWRRLTEGDDLAIHAGAHVPSATDFATVQKAIKAMGREMPPSYAHEFSGTLGRGRIVAVVTFAGVARGLDQVDPAQHPWWIGPYGWLFTNVRQLQLGSAPSALGQQGLWPLAPGTEKQVRSQLEARNEGQLWRKTAA